IKNKKHDNYKKYLHTYFIRPFVFYLSSRNLVNEVNYYLRRIYMTKHKIYSMSFASVYPHYVNKAERKGRTKEEVDEIIHWLTGYSQDELQTQIDNEIDF